MSHYQRYAPSVIFLRRSAVLIAGVLAFPVMLFRSDRARFYSYLHRIWASTSSKPLWLARAELAGGDFY